MGVPGSNPGGPIIFQRKIEGRQSHPAGGEKGLGQGWVFGGQYPGGPKNSGRKSRGQYLGSSSTNAGVSTFTFSAKVLPWWVRRYRDRRRAPREPFHPCRSKASSGFRHRLCDHQLYSQEEQCVARKTTSY